MEKYYCECINVIINVQEAREVKGRDFIHQLGENVELENVDPFFQKFLLDVTLGISGIEIAQESLLKERSYGDWLVFNCLNCGRDSHSIHLIKGVDRVLLPSDHATKGGAPFVIEWVKHGINLLKSIKSSSTYSDIFNLNIEENGKRNAQSLKTKNISEISAKIGNTANKFLKVEEDAMNERIRLFTDSQKLEYQNIKMKTNQHKEKILKKVRQFESNQMESMFDSFNESYFGGDIAKSEERDLSTDLPQIKVIRTIPAKQSLSTNLDNYSPIAQSLPSNMMMSPIKNKVRRRGKVSSRHRSFSESDDTMFDLEGFQEDKNCEPFYESDDESSGDATSLESSGGYAIPSSRGLNPGDRVYATSVPVSIPLFENMKNSYDPESDDDEQGNSPSPNHIADSIKALAKSMQDSTSIFGDIPRPRLNTLRT